jgi:hypothetical protein
MPSELDIALYLALGAIAAVYGYAAFSAFAIRRTLSEGSYRGQALGLGILAILLAYFIIFTTLLPPGAPVSGLPAAIGFFTYYGTFIGTFYWIDSSIRAARLTDPQVRDTLHWKKLRIAFWGYDAVATIAFLTAAVSGVNLSAGTGQGPQGIVLYALLGPLFIMGFSGLVALPLASLRSKDKILRRHLNWVVVFAAVFFAVNFIWSPTAEEDLVLASLITAAAGYFLYCSAKSLVPLYTFKSESSASV